MRGFKSFELKEIKYWGGKQLNQDPELVGTEGLSANFLINPERLDMKGGRRKCN